VTDKKGAHRALHHSDAVPLEPGLAQAHISCSTARRQVHGGGGRRCPGTRSSGLHGQHSGSHCCFVGWWLLMIEGVRFGV
jgi:hypothetical protein